MWTGFIGFYGTPNIAETHEFYNTVLQLPLSLDQDACRIYAVPGGGHIGFCEHLAVCHTWKSPIITLLTDRVDQVYERLCQAGIESATKPQRNTQFNLYHFFVRDPAGYTVEIQQFLDKNWDAHHIEKARY